MHPVAIHKLRVNVKSLAAEARIIRMEIAKAPSSDIKNALAAHRHQRLRPEARLASLALAFARGTTYKVAEVNAKAQPSGRQLMEKIRRFDSSVTEAAVLDWLKGVVVHPHHD